MSNNGCESSAKSKDQYDEKLAVDSKNTSRRRSTSSSCSDEVKKDPIKKRSEAAEDKYRKKDSSSRSSRTKHTNEHKKQELSSERRSYGSKRPSSHSRSPDRRRRRERSPFRSRYRSNSRERYRDRSPRRRGSRSRGHNYRSRDRRHSRSRSYERRHYRRNRSSSRERYRRRRRSHSSSRSRSHSRMSSRERVKGKAGASTSSSSSKVGTLPLSTTAATMTPQMALQQTMAAMSAKAQALTGIELPKYYNPAAVNPLKYAEQVQKRKLLWQTKDKEKEEQGKGSVWDKLKFAQDQDGKMTAKFRKLMGIKGEGTSEPEESEEKTEVPTDAAALQNQEELFRNLDQQYEMARMSTHTHRGVGLGYSSQAIFPPLQKP